MEQLDPIAAQQADNLIYWAARTAKTQEELTDKSIEQAQKQLARYYASAQKSVIADFLRTYEHLLLRQEGNKVTPADLYKLGRYWEMQNALAEELRNLGNRQAMALEKVFVRQYQEIYSSLAIPSEKAFATVSKQAALQAINTIWCADGKSWSDRIWENTELLNQELNEKLIETVTAGRKPTQLKKDLQERFGVAFYCADRVVRTESAHIAAQSAQQRYIDSGITEMQVWASKDERRCDVCGKLHEKKYPVHAISPLPAHPNCRCTLIPVI